MADALDLRPPPPDALETSTPRLEVPAWQARRVARQTRRLPKAAARWVDDQLAHRGSCGPIITDRLVAQAAAYDPEEHRRREERVDLSGCGAVPPCTPASSPDSSTYRGHGDTLALQAFYDLVCAIAHQLFLDGDTDPLGARKIKAIGVSSPCGQALGLRRDQNGRAR